MPVSWYFYRFDYDRYIQVRPALRAARTEEEFERLASRPSLAGLLQSHDGTEDSAKALRSAFLQEICCLGDPLPFDRGLPGFVAGLARNEESEDAAELLSALLVAAHNMEPWLDPSAGLIGFLTPDETLKLARSYESLLRHARRHLSTVRGRRRRGGLVGATRGFFRRMLNQDLLPEDVLALLSDLVALAAMSQDGIAVVAA